MLSSFLSSLNWPGYKPPITDHLGIIFSFILWFLCSQPQIMSCTTTKKHLLTVEINPLREHLAGSKTLGPIQMNGAKNTEKRYCFMRTCVGSRKQYRHREKTDFVYPALPLFGDPFFQSVSCCRADIAYLIRRLAASSARINGTRPSNLQWLKMLEQTFVDCRWREPWVSKQR